MSTADVNRLGIFVGVCLSSKPNKQNSPFNIEVPQSSIILDPGSGLMPGQRIALAHQIRALSVDRIDGARQGHVIAPILYEIEAAVKYVLEMP